MNFEFSIKLDVPEVYKAYWLLKSEKQALLSVNFEKCTFEEIAFKVFGGYKDEKKFIFQYCLYQFGWNLTVRRLKYTRTNPAKFIKIWWTVRILKNNAIYQN